MPCDIEIRFEHTRNPVQFIEKPHKRLKQRRSVYSSPGSGLTKVAEQLTQLLKSTHRLLRAHSIKNGLTFSNQITINYAE